MIPEGPWELEFHFFEDYPSRDYWQTLTIRMGQGRKGGVELKDFLRANKSWKENSN